MGYILIDAFVGARLRMCRERGHARCAAQTIHEREAMLQHKSTSEYERRLLNETLDAS